MGEKQLCALHKCQMIVAFLRDVLRVFWSHNEAQRLTMVGGQSLPMVLQCPLPTGKQLFSFTLNLSDFSSNEIIHITQNNNKRYSIYMFL